MSPKRGRDAIDAEISEAFGVSADQIASWRALGIQVTREESGLGVWSPGYPDVPAEIHPIHHQPKEGAR